MSTATSPAMMDSIARMKRNHNLAMEALRNTFRSPKAWPVNLKEVIERSKAAGILLESIRCLEGQAPMNDQHLLDVLERALRESREIFVKTTAKFESLSAEDQANSIMTIAFIAKELIFDWQKPLS